MQYEITLPADYDMAIIRDRVRTRGHALDDFPGLGLKAYCIRERGVDGSPVNQYAPFYLWASTDGMGHFLGGGAGFQGIVSDFGRPAVQHWTGVAAEAGPARGAPPTAAVKHVEPIPASADLTAVATRAVAELRDRVTEPGVHTGAVGIDPRHWELMHVTLYAAAVPESAPGARYEVLHLSAPELDLPSSAART